MIEIHKDTGEKSDNEEEKEEEKVEEQPAVDETGRILFRKRAPKTGSKRELQAIIDAEKGTLKKKKKKQKVSLLSFEDKD